MYFKVMSYKTFEGNDKKIYQNKPTEGSPDRDLTPETTEYKAVVVSEQQEHIHEVPIIPHDNLQRESHKPYARPTSIELLRKQQTKTGTPTALTAETH